MNSDLHLPWVPVKPKHPLGWTTMQIACCFSLTREIETSLALATQGSRDAQKLTVHWTLPISKPDLQKGSHTLVGGHMGEQHTHQNLPILRNVKHMEEVKRRCGNHDGVLPPKLPVFPNADGEVIDKLMAVNAISMRRR